MSISQTSNLIDTPFQKTGRIISRNGADGRSNKCNTYLCVVDEFDLTEKFDINVVTGERTSAGLVQTLGTGVYNWSPEDSAVLLNKLGNKLAPAGFNHSVALAEIDKTAKMVADTGSHVSNILHALSEKNWRLAAKLTSERYQRHLNRSGRRGMARRARGELVNIPSRKSKGVLSESAQGFLIVQYGIVPLIKDVHDGAEALAHIVSKMSPTKFVAQKSSSVSREFLTWNNQVAGRETVTITKRLTVYNDALRPNPIGAYAPDPLQIAWERVPYSFVVDWFMGIGRYLETIDTLGTFVTGSVCEAITIKASTETNSWAEGDVAHVYAGNKTKRIVFRRGPGSLEVPLPTLRPFQAAMSPSHVANALALAFAPRGTASRF